MNRAADYSTNNLHKVAEVLVPGVPRSLFYEIPEGFTEPIVGALLAVPLGNRLSVGWGVGTFTYDQIASQLSADKAESQSAQLELISSGETRPRLKSIISALPTFPSEQFQLFQWMSEYYGAPLLEVLETAVPVPPSEVRKLLTPPKRKVATPQAARIGESHFASPRPDRLTTDQHQALDAVYRALNSEVFSTTLLMGVTGSGKTEVYIRAAEHVLKEERGGVLIIVPEIALTPQLLDQFQSRLGSTLALLHSQVGSGERWRTWKKLLSGEIRVALGARSAVFAPISPLRLIVVDEEHETSYKQSDSLRYHGRDVAVMRAKISNCPIVLGSATPSFESLANATLNRYKLVEMPNRVTNRPLPEIEIVNLTQLKRRDMISENISPPLYQAIAQVLEDKGQVILLYNRRGFASFLQCESCGTAVSCPNCSVSLTYHQKAGYLLCHYCDYRISPIPQWCSSCRDPRLTRLETEAEESPVGQLSHRGAGTERVVAEIAQLFPQAKILQMDRDTVGKKEAYREILGSMRSGKADILVGTQMIAKGHDLPGVTLVGIIDADVGLHIPDFRSSERAFQLITQAAGRAGRGSTQGRVLVQTREPNHPTIVAAATGRFKAFARYELDFRKNLNYPPWTRLMRVVISSTDKHEAERATALSSKFLASLLSLESENTRPLVVGPAPAPHERLRGRYRFHLLVKSNSAAVLSRLARELKRWKDSLPQDDFRLTVDIDPVDML